MRGVIPGAILLILSMEGLQPIETHFKRRIKNITIHVEYDAAENLDDIVAVVKDRGAYLFDIDEETVSPGASYRSAILAMRMGKEHPSHSGMLSALAELPCVHAVRELIS